MQLELAIQWLEGAAEFDTALPSRRKPLASRAQPIRSSVRGYGCSSPAEVKRETRRILLAVTEDRTLTDLTRAAVMQSIRAGYDEAQCFRVSRLAGNFADAQGVAAERIRTLQLATNFLDIGNMGVSDQLLRKPDALSIVERSIVDAHAALGAELLLRTRLAILEPCVPIVRFHHECWDGTGPTSLSGHNIPLEARVASLCSAFDSLTHDRPWRPAQTADIALRILESEAASRFDPELCRSFVSWMRGELLRHPACDWNREAEAEQTGFVQVRRRIRQIAESCMP